MIVTFFSTSKNIISFYFIFVLFFNYIRYTFVSFIMKKKLFLRVIFSQNRPKWKKNMQVTNELEIFDLKFVISMLKLVLAKIKGIF
jgi:hypothetical protein